MTRDMKLMSRKELAVAVLLYQYQQEWGGNRTLRQSIPAIFEAFKVAAEGRTLISCLLRISGDRAFVELTYDDDLMEHIADVVKADAVLGNHGSKIQSW